MSEQIVDESEIGTAISSVETVEPAALDPNPALAEDLLRIRALLERGDVDGAREFVKELELRWPESARVRHLARVLAPPVARVVPGARHRSFAREHAWLRAHAREYPGCWLAVFEGRLIAADPDLGVVMDIVRKTRGAETALLHFQSRPEK